MAPSGPFFIPEKGNNMGMAQYPSHHHSPLGLARADYEWLKSVGAIYEEVDCHGKVIDCGLNVGPLRKLLTKQYPDAECLEDYVDEWELLAGITPISGQAWLEGFQDLSFEECDTFIKAIISKDSRNTIRQGPDKLLFENDAVNP